MTRVLCAGLLTMDLVHRIDRFPETDEKVVATAQRLEVGGPAANAARTAAALGAEVTLLAPFGQCPLTGFATEVLAGAGIDWIDPAAGQQNPAPLSSVLIEPDGSRRVISGGALPLPGHWRGDALFAGDRGRLDAMSALLIDGHGGRLPALLAAAGRARGIPVLLDGGSFKPGMPDYFRYVDLALLSDSFAVPGGGDPLDWALANGARAAARSRGARDLLLKTNSGVQRIPVPQVRAVDTNGAGDVLHGAALVALAATGEPAAYPALLNYAALVASASVAHPGVLGWVGQFAPPAYPG